MSSSFKRWIIAGLAVGVIIALFFTVKATIFGYVLHNVPPGSIAVKLRQNVVVDVVNQGVYHDTDWFADIRNIDVSVLRWCAFDSEVLTKGENSSIGQRIGLVVCGTVQRPGYIDKDKYLANDAKLWSDYHEYFTNNPFLVGIFTETTNELGDTVVTVKQAGLMQSLAQQAMKVCVGERTFAQATVGNKRDDLATCIQEEVEGRASVYGGITVANVTVPNVGLTPAARELVDTITTSQLETERLAQDAKKALAQGVYNLAEQQAQIMVEQGKIQETERQKAITAGLEVTRLESERAVIEATASNSLLAAEKALSVNQALFESKMLQAKADRADDLYFATILQNNPAYTNWLIAQVWSQAIKDTDKIIPVGSNPYTIINPWGGTSGFVLPQAPE